MLIPCIIKVSVLGYFHLHIKILFNFLNLVNLCLQICYLVNYIIVTVTKY